MAARIEVNRTCCSCGITEKAKSDQTGKKEKFKNCGRCHIATYCSKDCQGTAWKAHKAICEQSVGKKEIAKESLVAAAQKRADQSPAYAAYLQTPEGQEYMRDREAKEALRGPALQALKGDLSNRHMERMLAADPEFARLYAKIAVEQSAGLGMGALSDAEQMAFISKFTQLMQNQ